MFAIIIVLTVITAILLIGVVLIQKSKGGGLSSSFAGSNQIMGVRRTNNFIEKITWWLAGIICFLAVVSTFFMPSAITRTTRVSAPQAQQSAATNYNTNVPSNNTTTPTLPGTQAQ